MQADILPEGLTSQGNEEEGGKGGGGEWGEGALAE